MALRYLTSGESHGKALTAVIDGMPAGLPIKASQIDSELRRRQGGHGRGGRMAIEKDSVEVLSGIRHGKTLGSPISLLIRNLDWGNWAEVMAPSDITSWDRSREVKRPRPGHADLAGGLKYGHTDLRDVLERSSARETAARVAVGAVARRLLDEFGIRVLSWVTSIGGVEWGRGGMVGGMGRVSTESPDELFDMAEASEVRCPVALAGKRMIKRIDEARRRGDSLGGTFEVVAIGVPPGLGSHVQWDRKLDGALARSLMSIQAIKGVEVGAGFSMAILPGSKVHDEIFYGVPGGKGGKGGRKGPLFWPLHKRFYRKTNNAGGIEGGMSNGEPVVVRAVMKPIPTLKKPLSSVDIETKRPIEASFERSDVCAVPAASVVAEAAVAFELASAFLEKFGGDSIEELGRNYRGYLQQVSRY